MHTTIRANKVSYSYIPVVTLIAQDGASDGGSDSERVPSLRTFLATSEVLFCFVNKRLSNRHINSSNSEDIMYYKQPEVIKTHELTI